MSAIMPPTRAPPNYSDFVCVDDFEQFALKVLPVNAKDYYKSGACAQETLRNNKEAFRRLRIRPRVMRDLSKRTLVTDALGHPVQIPIGVSPAAMQKLAHEEGEIGNAAAVGEVGGIYILSTISTTSIEELAEKTPQTTKWFQLYIYRDREITKSLVQRAEKAGYKALVLTVDTNVFGTRYADIRNKFNMPSHLKLANFSGKLSQLSNTSDSSSLLAYITSQLDETINWSDVTWLKTITKLPIVLKGILTAEDAKIGVEMGASAIMVSNHGGRQLDYVPASIEALPEIAKAVGHKVDVYLDGGVRYGTDVFKALALGAKMVFVGRPALWGLAHSGKSGVRKVLDILINEFDQALALSGCTSVGEIQREMVVHETYYSKL
ncbi:peroxisomal (S)-2-hydroxy-acid oxidase GLO3-like isoform X2 [Diaphorina citri]|uniref:(S)-2-hydroxy-acid oxidase n=1 Tax=Diaphorina citri TaxID=121845 RepID=A0A1S4EHV3_DIACI|nr:peroxisomal (S)-2-hydroxy-acid oxidase GLO3-like isoform X2 [Diaphorina citri]